MVHVDAGSSEEFYDYDADGRRVYKRVLEGTPYVEDFDDGDIDDGSPTDWYTTGSYWDASSGELKWTSSGSQSGQCSNPDLTYDDFTAEFDLMADGYDQTNYWAAFAFRKDDYDDLYNISGYMVYYRYNGLIELHEAGAGVLATSNTGLDLSTWRHVKIVTSGSAIAVYVDGNLEISHTDGTYTDGYFGLNVFGVAARYDDLEIRDERGVHYIRDVNGDVLAEYNEAGDLLAEYVYATGQRIAKLTPSEGTDIYLTTIFGLGARHDRQRLERQLLPVWRGRLADRFRCRHPV